MEPYARLALDTPRYHDDNLLDKGECLLQLENLLSETEKECIFR